MCVCVCVVTYIHMNEGMYMGNYSNLKRNWDKMTFKNNSMKETKKKLNSH